MIFSGVEQTMPISDELLNYLGSYYINSPQLQNKLTFQDFIIAWHKGEYQN